MQPSQILTASLSILPLLTNPSPPDRSSTDSTDVDDRPTPRFINPDATTGAHTRPVSITGTRTVTVVIPTGVDPGPSGQNDRYVSGRFCPWCPEILEPSSDEGECNLFVQMGGPGDGDAEGQGETLPWAVLDYNLTRVYAMGVARWDTPVVVDLVGGGGIVQYTGNYFVAERRNGVLPPLFVFNNQRFPPLDGHWKTYPLYGAGKEIVNARHVTFKCSTEVPCEVTGTCGGAGEHPMGDL